MAEPLTRAERECLRMAHAPIEQDKTVALECELCGHVTVTSVGSQVTCRHGGEWIPKVIAKDQMGARAREASQPEAWTAETTEQLILAEDER